MAQHDAISRHTLRGLRVINCRSLCDPSVTRWINCHSLRGPSWIDPLAEPPRSSWPEVDCCSLPNGLENEGGHILRAFVARRGLIGRPSCKIHRSFALWDRTVGTERALMRRIGGEGRLGVVVVQCTQKRKKGTYFCSCMLNWEIYGY